MIEEAIKSLRRGHEQSTSPSTLYERYPPSPPAGLCKESTTIVEGESSFRHQTLLASQITELNTNIDTQSSSVMSELANLRTMVKEHASPYGSDRTHTERSTGTTVSGNQLPPSNLVLNLLALVRGGVPLSIFIVSDQLC